MNNKYISFDSHDKHEIACFAKVIAALQNEGVSFKVERDFDSLRIILY